MSKTKHRYVPTQRKLDQQVNTDNMLIPDNKFDVWNGEIKRRYIFIFETSGTNSDGMLHPITRHILTTDYQLTPAILTKLLSEYVREYLVKNMQNSGDVNIKIVYNFINKDIPALSIKASDPIEYQAGILAKPFVKV